MTNIIRRSDERDRLQPYWIFWFNRKDPNQYIKKSRPIVNVHMETDKRRTSVSLLSPSVWLPDSGYSQVANTSPVTTGQIDRHGNELVLGQAWYQGGY